MRPLPCHPQTEIGSHSFVILRSGPQGRDEGSPGTSDRHVSVAAAPRAAWATTKDLPEPPAPLGQLDVHEILRDAFGATQNERSGRPPGGRPSDESLTTDGEIPMRHPQ